MTRRNRARDSAGTAQAVLGHAGPGARLVFSSGRHVRRDDRDRCSRRFLRVVAAFGPIARLSRFADLRVQEEACRRVFESDTRWTLVRGSDLEDEAPVRACPVSRPRPAPSPTDEPSRGLPPLTGSSRVSPAGSFLVLGSTPTEGPCRNRAFDEAKSESAAVNGPP